MPRKKTSGPLVLKTRRALNAWIREALAGTCVIESITPKPLVWRKQYDALPKPKPRVGKVSLYVYPSDLPANTRVTARCFELRVPNPVQWLVRQSFILPYESSRVGTSRGVWGPVGLDCQGFWFSGAEMTVRELAPRIMVIAQDYDLEAFSYAFADPSRFPPPTWWLETALEAGFNMVPINLRGFPITVEQLLADRWSWTFAERRPQNLRRPLSFEVWQYGDRGFRVHVSGISEKERGDVLEKSVARRVRAFATPADPQRELRVHPRRVAEPQGAARVDAHAGRSPARGHRRQRRAARCAAALVNARARPLAGTRAPKFRSGLENTAHPERSSRGTFRERSRRTSVRSPSGRSSFHSGRPGAVGLRSG